MKNISRREFQQSAMLAAAARFGIGTSAAAPAEACNPPFYPALDYQPQFSHGWIELTVPRVFVHAAVRIDL